MGEHAVLRNIFSIRVQLHTSQTHVANIHYLRDFLRQLLRQNGMPGQTSYIHFLGKRQKPANKEANGRCNLFLSYPLLCHPKLSKKYRERKVVRWIAVLASTLGTNCNDASNNSREIRQKGHHVGTFRLLRDGFKCFKLKNSIPNPNYSVVC